MTREAQDLTLRQAAALANVSPAQLSRVERGLRQPTRRFLDKVERAFGHNIARGGHR